MTEREAFLRQAASDFQAYRALGSTDLPACHRLHQLQMTTEKLAKAVALAGTRTPLGRTHAAWSKVILVLRTHTNIAQALEMDEGTYKNFMRRILSLSRAIDALHPQVPTLGVGDHENVEYPWFTASAAGANVWRAPADHTFTLEFQLQTADGAMLLKLIERLLTSFDRIF